MKLSKWNLYRKGCHPLHIASHLGHTSAAQILIKSGGDAVSAADQDGETPLHVAAWNGHEAVARLLVDRGADVGADDGYGNTPLHVAARNGHEAVARLLRHAESTCS